MERENKMATTPVRQLIVQMALPPLLSMFMQYSYNMIDSIYVSALGEDALSAVSLAYPLTTFMNAASIWVGVGVNILVARRLGEKDQEGADRTTTLGLGLSVVLGALLNCLVLLGMGPYFDLFAEGSGIRTLCAEYMWICAFMQIPNMVHICIQKILQGTGNMILPMWFQVAGVVFNLVFDPIFIFGLFGFPYMGIRGAALSTVLGFTLSMVLALVMLLRGKQRVRFRPGYLFDCRGLSVYASMIRLGFPSFVMNVLGACMVGMVNGVLIRFSQTAVAFFGAYTKLQQMFVMTVNGLIQGCLPVMSFSYGAKEYGRMRQAYRCASAFANGLLGIGGVLLLLFPGAFLRLFRASGEMLTMGIPAVRTLCLGMFCIGSTSMAATYLQAAGQVGKSVLIHLLRQVVLLMPLVWLLSARFGLSGVWAAFPLAEVLTVCTALYQLRRCRLETAGE